MPYSRSSARPSPSPAWRWLPACLLLAGCAAANGDRLMPQEPTTDPATPASAARVELPGDGPYQRFIVRYRADSPAGRESSAVPGKLREAAASLDPRPTLAWQRRLAVGGDVFTVDPPLDKNQARRLMQAIAADPQVESIDVDRKLGIDPPREMRMRGD